MALAGKRVLLMKRSKDKLHNQRDGLPVCGSASQRLWQGRAGAWALRKDQVLLPGRSRTSATSIDRPRGIETMLSRTYSEIKR